VLIEKPLEAVPISFIEFAFGFPVVSFRVPYHLDL